MESSTNRSSTSAQLLLSLSHVVTSVFRTVDFLGPGDARSGSFIYNESVMTPLSSAGDPVLAFRQNLLLEEDVNVAET